MTPVKSQAVQIEMVEKLSGLSLASELQRDISASPETLTINGNADMWKLLVGGNQHSGCLGLYRRTPSVCNIQPVWKHEIAKYFHIDNISCEYYLFYTGIYQKILL